MVVLGKAWSNNKESTYMYSAPANVNWRSSDHCLMWSRRNIKWSPNYQGLTGPRWPGTFNTKLSSHIEKQTGFSSWAVWPQGPISEKKVETSTVHHLLVLEKMVKRIPCHTTRKTKVDWNQTQPEKRRHHFDFLKNLMVQVVCIGEKTNFSRVHTARCVSRTLPSTNWGITLTLS